MPSPSRRREQDGRAGRFESQVGADELQDPKLWERRKELPFCRACGTAFQEKSRHCPRCDKKTNMGVLKPIPERLQAEAQRNAIKRLGR